MPSTSADGCTKRDHCTRHNCCFRLECKHYTNDQLWLTAPHYTQPHAHSNTDSEATQPTQSKPNPESKSKPRAYNDHGELFFGPHEPVGQPDADHSWSGDQQHCLTANNHRQHPSQQFLNLSLAFELIRKATDTVFPLKWYLSF